MARCSAAGRTSAPPTSVRGPSLYATAAVRPKVVEVGVFNTTTTAVAVALARATARGTPGAAVTATNESEPSNTVVGTCYNTHTADATVGTAFRQASLGAAIGSGCIWTFGGVGVDVQVEP